MSATKARQSAPAGTEATLSQKIAGFIARFAAADAPVKAVELATLAFTDTVGVMFAGSREPPGEIAAELVRAEGAKPQVAVVGRPFRTSVANAAFANGVAGHAMDYDFSYAIGQSASPVVPSLLALAQATKANSEEVIAAFIVGCEVASRLARTTPNLSNGYGWHASGTIGAVAAAAACAKLAKVPADRVPDIIGIAASMAAGLGVNYGTMSKPLHAGQAARSGVIAMQLGARGFTSSPDTLEGRTGFIELFAPPTDWPRDAFDDLGSSWHLIERGVTVKLYPCGGLLHTGIEAALQLRERVRLEDLSAVHVGVTMHAAKRARRTIYPETVERAKFSMQYAVAYTLVHGAPMLEAFTEEAIEDQRVRDAFKLVTASVDERFAATPNQGPARITATLKDGRTVELVRENASGTPKEPLTPAQLKAKFMSCAVHAVTPDRAEAIYARLHRLPATPSLDDLWPLLST